MRSLRRCAVAAAAGAVVLVLMAVPAWAHVTIDPDSVPQGASDVTLTFRVPNEETSADTTKIDIQFPTDHPIAVVNPAAENGWTPQVTMKHLDSPITTDDGTFSDVVSEIVWTGGKIGPGQFGEFKVLAQGFPTGTDSLRFPAVQTYSDGTVVSWIQDAPAGGTAPEHPTPVLTLTPAADNSSSSSSAESSSSSSAPTVSVTPPSTTVKKETDNALAIVAIVVSALALIAAIAALLRRPNRA